VYIGYMTEQTDEAGEAGSEKDKRGGGRRMDPGASDLCIKTDADDDPCIRLYPATFAFPALDVRTWAK